MLLLAWTEEQTWGMWRPLPTSVQLRAPATCVPLLMLYPRTLGCPELSLLLVPFQLRAARSPAPTKRQSGDALDQSPLYIFHIFCPRQRDPGSPENSPGRCHQNWSFSELQVSSLHSVFPAPKWSKPLPSEDVEGHQRH